MTLRLRLGLGLTGAPGAPRDSGDPSPYIRLTGDRTVSRTDPVGTLVGSFTIVNDPGGEWEYTLTSNPGDRFAIDGADLETAQSPISPGRHSIGVAATDGELTLNRTFGIDVEFVPIVPEAISDLLAEGISQTQIEVAFTAAVGATSHQYRLDGGAAVNLVGDTISGLAPGTSYSVQVRGVNVDGPGPWSNTASASTEAAPVLPGPISDLLATPVSTTQIDLSFTPSPAATSHQYRIGTGAAVTLSGTEITDLTPDTEYAFQVRGVNDDGNGDWSNIASARTEAEVAGPRVAFVGHSLVSPDLPAMYLAIDPRATVNWQVIVGSPLWLNWQDHETAQIPAEQLGPPRQSVRQLLSAVEIDHLVLTEAGPIEQHITWSDTREWLQTWRAEGLAQNPDIRAYWYEIWPAIDLEGIDGDWDLWRAEIARLAEEAYGPQLELIADDIAPARILLSPAGEALAALYDAIEADEVPDLDDIEDLFSDAIHLTPLGFWFVATVHWTTINRMSPARILFNPSGIGLTEAMAEAMQELIWDVVSQHPYAGIADWPTPAEPTAPDAFTAGQWSATAGDGEIAVVVIELPDNGGAAITDVEYRVGSGSWVSFVSTAGGTISGLTNDEPYDITIRAVNAVGAGAASDVKTRTPAEDIEPAGITVGAWNGSTTDTWPTASATYDYTVDVGDAGPGRHVVAFVNRYYDILTLDAAALDPADANVAGTVVANVASNDISPTAPRMYAFMIAVPEDMSGEQTMRVTASQNSEGQYTPWNSALNYIVLTGASADGVVSYTKGFQNDLGTVTIPGFAEGHAALMVNIGGDQDTMILGDVGEWGTSLYVAAMDGYRAVQVANRDIGESYIPSTGGLTIVLDISPA